jgi:hypothetical protein
VTRERERRAHGEPEDGTTTERSAVPATAAAE